MLLRRVLAIFMMLLLVSASFPLEFIHLLFHSHHQHHHSHNHQNHDLNCADDDPCHLSLYHAAEHSEKACSHDAHFTEDEQECCQCDNYSVSVLKFLNNSESKVYCYGKFDRVKSNFTFSFAGKYFKNCADRGPPSLQFANFS